MEKGVITKEDVAKVILFGACTDRIPKVGTRLENLPTSDLIWAERLLPIKGFKNRLPLWVLSGDGFDGDGYGFGFGSGDGDGDGYGDGYDGFGYGYGDGYGFGYGSGDGDGYGYGYGYGYGSGYGDGDGDGYGDGYKQLPLLLN